MAPGRFAKSDRRRDVTPYREEPAPASIVPMRPTTPHPDRQGSVDREMFDRPVTPAPAEWTSMDAPINFTWVIPDELCGMGWPKSRDQVRFLTEQGIEHLVSLSPEKIPPHYAFPDLQHTLIPVEDFTGPTIAEIQKFLEITDDARKEGMAVGVHCAEGRGRTGVMCACYLIYYYDMEPWDAIRIMRRQRPGSVERKVQEETVVRFFTLLQDYGKSSVEKLEEREKQLLEIQKKQQAELIRNDNMVANQATMNLLSHMHSFHTKQTNEAKQERITRMRRARSVPKMEDEEEMNALKLKNHIQALLQGDRQKRSKSQHRARNTEEEESDCDRMSRATTPGKSLIEVNLKPVKDRTIAAPTSQAQVEKCELKNHFRDFMNSPLKRGRSFSQPREKEQTGGTPTTCLSRKESFEQKYVQDSMEQEKGELANHTKRFLKRKSMITTGKNSDESDNDSLSKDKPGTPDNKDQSDNDEEAVTKIAAKPPPFKSMNELKTQRRLQRNSADRRNRSKSDVTVPKIYDLFEDKDKSVEKQVEETPKIEQEPEPSPEKESMPVTNNITYVSNGYNNFNNFDAAEMPDLEYDLQSDLANEIDYLTEKTDTLEVTSRGVVDLGVFNNTYNLCMGATNSDNLELTNETNDDLEESEKANNILEEPYKTKVSLEASYETNIDLEEPYKGKLSLEVSNKTNIDLEVSNLSNADSVVSNTTAEIPNKTNSGLEVPNEAIVEIEETVQNIGLYTPDSENRQEESIVPRIRKINMEATNDYCYVSAKLKVTNAKPKPFIASPVEEKEAPVYYRRFSKESTETEQKAASPKPVYQSTPHVEHNLSQPSTVTDKDKCANVDDKDVSRNQSVMRETSNYSYNHEEKNITANDDISNKIIERNEVKERKRADNTSERRRSRDKRSIDKENKDRKNSETSQRVRESKYNDYYPETNSNYTRERSNLNDEKSEGNYSLDYSSSTNTGRKSSMDYGSSNNTRSKSSLEYVSPSNDGRKSRFDHGSYDNNRHKSSMDYGSSSNGRKSSMDHGSSYYNGRKTSTDYSSRKTSLDQSASDYYTSRKSSVEQQTGSSSGSTGYEQYTSRKPSNAYSSSSDQVTDYERRRSSVTQHQVMDNRHTGSTDNEKLDNYPGYYSSSTSEMVKACKSGLRRLTYRKTYTRTKSNTDMEQDKNNNSTGGEAVDKYDCARGITYTRLPSGTKLPNRPTTPGPYLNNERNSTAGLYTPIKRPTTPGPFSRDSWKRTNQKFNYAKILNCSGKETFV